MQTFFKNLLSKRSTPIIPEPVEEEQCAACGEMVPETDGESVVVFTHRIEGRAVAQDWEWVCDDCIESAEEMRTERMVEARRQYYEEK